MIHILYNGTSHTETLQSLVATCERIGAAYQIYFTESTPSSNRFDIRSFRPHKQLAKDRDIMSYTSDGDTVLFVTTDHAGAASGRWDFLINSGRRVVGIEHEPRACYGNRIEHIRLCRPHGFAGRVYHQVEDPFPDTEHSQGGYLLYVGSLSNCFRMCGDAQREALRNLGVPVVFAGSGTRLHRDRLRREGFDVLEDVDDTKLTTLSRDAMGILYPMDPSLATSFIDQKISGSFPLSIKRAKPLVSHPAFYQGRFPNGIDIRSADLSEGNVRRVSRMAEIERDRMISSNANLFEDLA